MSAYREALLTIAVMRQDQGDWDEPDYDWQMLARKMENVARTILGTNDKNPLATIDKEADTR